jgi:alpha-methylacyl-CoA racemase
MSVSASRAAPLQGIRVLDLSRLLPGPFCSLYLAQMGAEVIKIEEPGIGDYARGMREVFAQVNRGKKSVVLDLKDATGRDRFLKLAETADVVLESFRPGVMDKLGCGYDILSQRNPRLVYAALTGYGQTGPCRDWAGHDVNYLAMAGVLDQIGTAGGSPALANVQIADLAGGALTCAIGLLAAVIGARSSGHGSFVDVSMMDGALALQTVTLSALREHGTLPRRGAGPLSGALPNYNVYRCRDGKYLAVGAVEPKFFMNMLRVMRGRLPPALLALLPKPLRSKGAGGAAAAHKDPFGKLGKLMQRPERLRRLTTPVRLALAAVFLTRPRDYWADLLQEQDACVTPILGLDEVLDHRHVRARGMVDPLDEKPCLSLPLLFSGQRLKTGPAPELGEHTAQVLAGLDDGHPRERLR